MSSSPAGNSSPTLTKVSKVGAGTYGTVYKAVRTIPVLASSPPATTAGALPGSPERASSSPVSTGSPVTMTQLVAVKRNLTTFGVTGASSVSEMDILARLKGGPFIVDLLQVVSGTPFGANPMTPIPHQANVKKLEQTKEDNIHFVLEFISKAGHDIFYDKRVCTPDIARALACQFVLGLEYIHAKNVLHRDLKPANLLIELNTKEGPRLKICDYGLSQILSRTMTSTPGVCSSWYRAPEICAGSYRYGYELDMWSCGAVIFEMFAKEAFLYGLEDKNELLFNELYNRHPVQPDLKSIEKCRELSGGVLGKKLNPPIYRKSFIEQMQMTKEYQAAFNKAGCSAADLEDLLLNLMNFDPTKRLTATQVLDHKFFDPLRKSYIEPIRQMYPPVPPALPVLHIHSCVERKWAADTIIGLYNVQAAISWAADIRLLFHGMEIFDRYIHYGLKTPKRDDETPVMGRLHNKRETELRLYVCLYLLHKYYTALSVPLEWRAFAPEVFHNQSDALVASEFENLLLGHVCRYHIYNHTLLEVPEMFNIQVDQKMARDLLTTYCKTDTWHESVRALYRKIQNIPTPP